MEPMQQPDVFTTCPTCHARINVTAALHTFLTTIADETLPEQFYLSLHCGHCNRDTVALFLQPEEILGRVCKLEPEHDRGDSQHGKIVFSPLLIARSNAP